jgi:hypothetical protein
VTFFLLILALQGQGSLRAVEQQIALAERVELREPGSPRFPTLDPERLTRARRQVEAFLQTTPDDPAALVLFARVGRFILHESRGASCSPAHGCALDSTYDDAPFHAALDRALRMRPTDAAAHFWKARLLDDGRPVLHGSEFAVDVDTVQMLAHAQRAVALEPGTLRYREFLAVKLTDVGRYREAEDVIEKAGRKHPLYLTLRDFADIPIPENAAPWPRHAIFAAMGMDESPPRFAAQTGRSWAVALSIDQLEAFYRRRWPGFRLFVVKSAADEEEGDPPEGWFQNLRADRNGKLQPAPDSTFIARLERANDFDGLLMAVRQVRRHDEGAPERYPAAMAGKEAFLEVVIVTGRKN